MEKRLIAIALLLLAQTANAQGIYYCTKNGKKIMTDQPCQALGADHKKYTPYENLQPLSTMEPPNESAIQRAKEFDREQTRWPPEQSRQAQNASATNKKARCTELEEQKQSIVAQQRAPQSGSSHDWLRSRRQEVESQMFSLGC